MISGNIFIRVVHINEIDANIAVVVSISRLLRSCLDYIASESIEDS